MFHRNMLVLCTLAWMAASVPALAQEGATILSQPDPDSPLGERNLNGPPELAQFDFVIGDWDAAIDWTSPEGEVTSYDARWHNIWIINGSTVHQEWRGPYMTGAEFRGWDRQKGEWSGRNFYPASGEWKTTRAEMQGENMVVYILDAANAQGPFINRETYFDITPDSFRMKSDRSFDDGETWQTGAYEMRCTRVP